MPTVSQNPFISLSASFNQVITQKSGTVTLQTAGQLSLQNVTITFDSSTYTWQFTGQFTISSADTLQSYTFGASGAGGQVSMGVGVTQVNQNLQPGSYTIVHRHKLIPKFTF